MRTCTHLEKTYQWKSAFIVTAFCSYLSAAGETFKICSVSEVYIENSAFFCWSHFLSFHIPTFLSSLLFMHFCAVEKDHYPVESAASSFHKTAPQGFQTHCQIINKFYSNWRKLRSLLAILNPPSAFTRDLKSLTVTILSQRLHTGQRK